MKIWSLDVVLNNICTNVFCKRNSLWVSVSFVVEGNIFEYWCGKHALHWRRMNGVFKSPVTQLFFNSFFKLIIIIIKNPSQHRIASPWASYQIRNIAGWACAGNVGNVFRPRHRLQRKPLVSDPGMHHGTWVTHVPWCMSRSWCNPRWRGKRSRHSQRMHSPQFYVSGKRHIVLENHQ